MQAIAETLFDIGYLISVITIGGMMIGKSNGKKEYRLFGIMAVILGVGDSFHLVPEFTLYAQPVWKTIPPFLALENLSLLLP